jgi:hypothetical protein
VSGNLTNMGTFHRFRIRVISVETAAILAQISIDLQNDEQAAFLLGGAPSTPVPREKTANVRNNWFSTELSRL